MDGFDCVVFRLAARPRADKATWLLWVEEDSQGNRLDRLWAGRVKLQDDPIATTYAVLDDALKKLEATLDGGHQPPLF